MSTLKDILSQEDYDLAVRFLGKDREPDLNIAPDGDPYLYRWYTIPRSKEANVYLHVQVASDPERPLHDHPWDNQSVILSGGYDEYIGQENRQMSAMSPAPWEPVRQTVEKRVKGGVYWRPAEAPHRLVLPDSIPYTMTLFTTGPVRRTWGFWVDDRVWFPHYQCVKHLPDGRSVWAMEDCHVEERDRG